MAIPDFQTLMLPLLRLAAAGETTVPKSLEVLAKEFKLSEEESNRPTSSGSQTTFYNRTHWAKTYMKKAGLLEITKRGHFRATQRGRTLLESNPPRIDNVVLSNFEDFRAFRALRRPKPAEEFDGPAEASDVATPEERIDAAFAEITSELLSALIQRLRGNSPAFFERAVLDLLVAMGYGGSRTEAAQRVGRSGDGGIDGVINQDPLGLDVVYVQAKRYADGNTIGSDKIREFAGSLDDRHATKGVFITTSGFSLSAKQTAERSPKRLILIDGEELGRLLVQHGIGVRSERVVDIKRLDLDYFSEEEAS
ncbi:MAG: restriction endonuclease [Alphaproteobacteria bacterium]|nr:restriction endonuclease [Alphaproteobacteria bacterium]